MCIRDRINRALAASAASMGANVVLKDRPGYTPLENEEQLYDLTCDCLLYTSSASIR